MAPRLQLSGQMLRRSLMRPLLVAVLLAVALPAHPAARLTYVLPGGAVPVYWPQSAFPIPYQIDRRAANMLSQATIDRAFGEWTTVTDATVSFAPGGVVDGAKAGKDGHNTVSLIDDLFQNQHFIAMTTNWYDDGGRMTEADIQIDPVAAGSNYNTQLLVEHEVGHLLGLDHSGVVSSVMYPFVGKGGSTELDSDDKIAIAGVYPREDPMAGGTIKGQVVGNDGAIFAAQVVAVNEEGEPVATDLTDGSGQFSLHGLPTGDYRVYAEPMDGPVDVQNLSGVWRSAKVVSFPTRFARAAAMHVDSGKIYGNVDVNSTGAPVTLNPRWIGAFPDGSTNVSLSSTPVFLKPGQTMALAVGGDGFTSGMATFVVLNPGFKRISEFRYAANYVYATFSIAPDAPAGSSVVVVTNGNESAMLTGALRLLAKERPRLVQK
jgi:hypothetical protein